MIDRSQPSTDYLSHPDHCCRLCRAACAPGGEFCRPCALDLALIGMYEHIAESSAQPLE